MDNLDTGGAAPTPEEALRQLIQLRMQLGPARFATVAQQMGMPSELLDHIEESVTELSGEGPRSSSGLVDTTGRPIGSAPSGLVDASGRPLGAIVGTVGATGPDSAGEESDLADLTDLDDEDDVELDEEASQRLFQELVGVRMIIGPDNFGTLAGQMGMPTEASEMVETAAGQVESEIGERYTDQDEAMTVRLVNARMMMGPERFADLAGQVGMPNEVVDQVEEIAGQIEGGGEPDQAAGEDSAQA